MKKHGATRPSTPTTAENSGALQRTGGNAPWPQQRGEVVADAARSFAGDSAMKPRAEIRGVLALELRRAARRTPAMSSARSASSCGDVVAARERVRVAHVDGEERDLATPSSRASVTKRGSSR